MNEPDRPIRLVLVDDHGVVRAGLQHVPARATKPGGGRRAVLAHRLIRREWQRHIHTCAAGCSVA
jgi:hypothetical protein